jgi:uncharacterized protein YuzE
MMRAMLSVGFLVGVVGLCLGDDKTEPKKDGDKKAKPATITKVDPVKKTVTLKCKDTEGKETEKTFKLDEEIRYVDSNGKVAAIDIFQIGNAVLIIEEEGKLKELRKTDVKKPGLEDKKDK